MGVEQPRTANRPAVLNAKRQTYLPPEPITSPNLFRKDTMPELDAAMETTTLREGYERLREQLAKAHKEYDKLIVDNAKLHNELAALREESAVAIEFMRHFKNAMRLL